MRRISANYIFPVTSKPLKNGIIEMDDQGMITGIIDTKGMLQESRKLEFYNGVIVPGFVNTHCHIELSDMKGLVPEHTGLPEFLKHVVAHKRQGDKRVTEGPIRSYDLLMKKKGIVAVGDIVNENISIGTKKNSSIYYYSFVEAIGLGNNADEIFDKNRELYNEFLKNGLPASINAHAPYSVSEKLFGLIKLFAEKENTVFTIHNQETLSENQLFCNKTGVLYDALVSMGINMGNWKQTGKNSLPSLFGLLPMENNILFVHNTFTEKKDVLLAQKYFKNAYWCLCPLSNLYIENRFPDVEMFNQMTDTITLGTDSLASNHNLSILDEMKVIAFNFKPIPFNRLLQWGTWNGARALKIDKRYGSLEIGKKPGVNLITGIDFENMGLTEKSDIVPLIY